VWEGKILASTRLVRNSCGGLKMNEKDEF
jgi:hypothetical protein